MLQDGRAAALPASKRTRALLGYLVATGRVHPRERLCDLLWEGPDDPRAALRWSLWKLRPLVDHGRTQRLLADRERVGFEPHGAQIDTVDVRAALRGGVAAATTEALEAAAERFRGDFLDGLELPDCYAFHEWCAGERGAFRALRLDVMAALGTRLADEPERALRYARERAALDPLSEDAHARLVRLLARLGRHGDAMKQYETCRRILQNELRVKPGATLEQARAAIRASVPVVDRPAAASPSAVAPGPPVRPLVGRARECGELDAIVAAARDGRMPEVLLVAGEPGIGKSRILEALHERVRKAGGIALVARAFEAERARPYGPFVDAFRDVTLADAPGDVAAEVSHLLSRSAAGAPEATDRNRLFDAMARLLDWLAASRIVCLSIDDLQWLDEASVALLHYCVRQVRSPVVVATAARSGELGDNPSALRLVRELARGKRLRQLALAPLERGEIAALVSAVAADVDVERVCARSEGHPLYALELARSGALAEDAPAESLDALIAERLVHVDDRALDVLPWMAAMGRTVQAEILADATQLPIADVLSALADLERRAVVRASGDRYDFAHDLIRLAAYRRIAAPQRRLIHARIAAALAARPDADTAWAVDVARHADLGGDSALCVRACIRASEQCLQIFAYGEAEALVELAQRHTPRLSDEQRIRGQMKLLSVLVHPGLKLRHPGTLGAQIADLCTEAADLGLDAECSRGFKLLATLHNHAFGDIPRARAAITRAVEVFEKLPTEANFEPLADAAYCLVYLEVDIPRTRALFSDLSRARGAGGSLGFQWGIGLLHLWDGELDRARDALGKAHALAARAKKKWVEFDTLAAIAMVELEAKRLDQVLALQGDLDRLAERLGDDGSERPLARGLVALARLERGEDGADRDVDAAASGLERADSRYHVAYVLNAAASADLRAGRLVDARRRAQAARRAADAAQRVGESRRAELLLAAIDAREGRPEDAQRIVTGAHPDDFASMPRRTRDILSVLRDLIAP